MTGTKKPINIDELGDLVNGLNDGEDQEEQGPLLEPGAAGVDPPVHPPATEPVDEAAGDDDDEDEPLADADRETANTEVGVTTSRLTENAGDDASSEETTAAADETDPAVALDREIEAFAAEDQERQADLQDIAGDLKEKADAIKQRRLDRTEVQRVRGDDGAAGSARGGSTSPHTLRALQSILPGLYAVVARWEHVSAAGQAPADTAAARHLVANRIRDAMTAAHALRDEWIEYSTLEESEMSAMLACGGELAGLAHWLAGEHAGQPHVDDLGVVARAAVQAAWQTPVPRAVTTDGASPKASTGSQEDAVYRVAAIRAAMRIHAGLAHILADADMDTTQAAEQVQRQTERAIQIATEMAQRVAPSGSDGADPRVFEALLDALAELFAQTCTVTSAVGPRKGEDDAAKTDLGGIWDRVTRRLAVVVDTVHTLFRDDLR